jgi:hypothetical protein
VPKKELVNENRFFSQEMASSSSHTSIPLSTLLEWYKIRDTFFGDNCVSQSIPLALELASSCQHPDARWLTEACAGKDVNETEDAKRVFSALCQNDARALCFSWRFGERRDLSPLRRSAELGFAFAQALLGGETGPSETFKFAQLAAAQGEREGFYFLSRCFRFGVGCDKNLGKAKELALLACDLGDVFAFTEFGSLLDESDSRRWHWWGRAAALGSSSVILSNFAKQVELFDSGAGIEPVMFAIGQALQGRVNEKERTIFTSSYCFDSRVGPAKQAIAFYEAQIKATKAAMHTWTLVGIRFNVVKDVRKLIAKLIWDAREGSSI